MRFAEITQRLDCCLRVAGCRGYRGGDALVDALETWRAIRADNAAHGEPADQPFCNWVLTEGVCLLAFYDGDIEFFVLAVAEPEFRRTFEPLAMAEVRRTRMLLRSKYDRCSPDVVMNQTLCRTWLDFCRGTAAG